MLNQQQVLQLARLVLVRRLTVQECSLLKQQVIVTGRSEEAVWRASIMRLAQWVRNLKSSI